MGTNPNVRKAPVAKRTEWNEYSPELIKAIRSGYLDDVAAQIAYELETRRKIVDRFGYYSQPTKEQTAKRTLKRKKVAKR